jgi:uncharacterized protein YdhG (YjbR/CyaY superfamily)
MGKTSGLWTKIDWEMTMDKKDIRKLITKAKNNGKKHIKHLSVCYKMIVDGSDKDFKTSNINIIFDDSKEYYGIAENHSYGHYTMTLNKNMDDELLWKIVTHELAHIMDFHVARKSLHDLQFIHLWAILSDFSINVVQEIISNCVDSDDVLNYREVLEGKRTKTPQICP